MLPALDPPEPHDSLKASTNFLRCSGVHGATFAGLMICAFSLPEECHRSFRKLPASICSCSVCLRALIGEI